MNGIALITSWCRQYVGRAATPQDIINGEALQTREQALELLSAVASCDEAFAHLSRPYDNWFNRVFLLLAGRRSSELEEAGANVMMIGSPGMSGRQAVARMLLTQYPPLL